MRRLAFGADGFGHMPQCLIKSQHQFRAKTAGQRCAGSAGKIADTAQAKTLQRGGHPVLDPQRCNGQFRQRAVRIAKMRTRPCRTTGFAQSKPQFQPGTLASGVHIGQHPGLTAQKMHRARDIKHQPVRALVAHPGTVARRPAAQDRQERRVEIGACGLADQVGTKGAGIGKAHIPAQAHPLGSAIEAINPFGVIGLERQREGAVNRTCPKNPVARQPGKPHRDDSFVDSIEHARHQVFLICS